MPYLHRAVGAAAILACTCPAWSQDAQPEEPPVQEPAQPDSWAKGWKGTVSAGLNGSSGNTETFSFRGEIAGTRDTARYATSAGLTYSFASSDGEETENRFDANARNDWKFTDSPWRFFAQGQFTADEFQDWDYRLSAFAGPGYVFLDDGTTFLLGRAGLGATREFGGSDEDIRPEGLLGLDASHQLTQRQKVFGTVEVYPSLDDGREYRGLAKAGWEILVDPEMNLSLRLGVEDRYDTDPGPGFKRNDFSYFALLSWSF